MKVLIINFLLFSGLFYFTYIILFRNKSFFSLNRWLLLAIPLLSIGIPLIAPYFDDPIYHSTGFSTTLLPEILISPTSNVKTEFVDSMDNSYVVAYVLGVILSSFLFLRGLIQIFSIVRSSETVNDENTTFAFSVKAKSPFSFFKHIILPYSLKEDHTLPTVLNHEKVHQEQKHSFDNLYYNILSILFWFNPFIHLLAKELRQTHECIADREALNETSREVYAHMLLSSTFGSEVALPANPFFNSSLLKTRITMLYKNESPKWLKIAYLAVIPLAIAMTLHACNKAPESVEAENVARAEAAVDFSKVDQVPLFDNCEASASIDEQRMCFSQEITKHIIENLKYPKEAYELGITGRVFIAFVITETGETDQITLKRGISVAEDASEDIKNAAKSLEDHAVSIIQSFPQFQPAQLNGKAVAMSFTLPIQFKLD